MADARISQLPAATTVASGDIFPFTSITFGETRKITANQLSIILTQLGLTVGTTQPSTPYNGQPWVDTNTNPPILKIYNGATFNNASTDNAADARYLQIATAASTYLALAGGTLTGDLTLNGNPSTANMASNKAYVDAQVATSLPLAGGTLTGNLTLVGDPSANNMAANKKYVDDQISAIPAVTDQTPAGTVIYTARTTAPTGYIKADGAAISRSTFSVLFAAIGTTFGTGDGSTTFNTPDLRSEFIRGFDDGRGIAEAVAFGQAQTDQNKQHNHTGSTSSSNGSHTHDYDQARPGTGTPGGGGNVFDFNSETSTGGGGSHSHNLSITNDPASNGGEARPRNINLLACIKI